MSKKVSRIGSQGWEEFLNSKQELLNIYEVSKIQTKHRPVKVEHGNVAEEAYRIWLTSFLPKRYGVTSGFIISAGYSSRVKLRHFDVIIYDRLEAPVLWHSNNPGKSSTGRDRAIPIEYVLHVAEVKARLTKKSAKEATQKLEELSPLLQLSVEGNSLLSSSYLPKKFTCSVIFFEVSNKVQKKHGDLVDLIKPRIRGYIGGAILKSPDDDIQKTAQILPVFSKVKKTSYGPQLFRDDPLMSFGGYWVWAEDPIDNIYYGVQWDWQENHFTDFAHNLINRLRNADISNFTWHARSRAQLHSDSDSFYGLDQRGI